jgi:hypothetical protein
MWQWEDGATWSIYTSEINKLLETAHHKAQKEITVQINGREYVLDLEKLRQASRNDKTKYRRIRRRTVADVQNMILPRLMKSAIEKKRVVNGRLGEVLESERSFWNAVSEKSDISLSKQQERIEKYISICSQADGNEKDQTPMSPTDFTELHKQNIVLLQQVGDNLKLQQDHLALSKPEITQDIQTDNMIDNMIEGNQSEQNPQQPNSLPPTTPDTLPTTSHQDTLQEHSLVLSEDQDFSPHPYSTHPEKQDNTIPALLTTEHNLIRVLQEQSSDIMKTLAISVYNDKDSKK